MHRRCMQLPKPLCEVQQYSELRLLPSSMPQRTAALPDFAKEFVAGGFAGALGKSSVAPLERAKILIQTGRAPTNNLLSVLQYMYRSDGMYGFFRGNGASVLRVVPYAALHYYSYEKFRSAFLLALFGGHLETQHRSPVWVDLLAGSAAGATAVVLTYPLDLIRTRMAWGMEEIPGRRATIAGTVANIVREGGVRALYQGSVPTLLGILPYAGIKFYTYQKLKRLWWQRSSASKENAKPPLYATLCFGGAAGLMAQTLTYPLDVVRRRMQVSRTHGASTAGQSMLQHARSIVAQGGWLGLFRGVSINYLKVTPSTAVGFTVYDQMKGLLGLENHL